MPQAMCMHLGASVERNQADAGITMKAPLCAKPYAASPSFLCYTVCQCQKVCQKCPLQSESCPHTRGSIRHQDKASPFQIVVVDLHAGYWVDHSRLSAIRGCPGGFRSLLRICM
jgi:hypothetical protein